MQTKKDPSVKGVSKLVGFQSAPLVGGDVAQVSTIAGQSQAGDAAGAAEVGHAPAWTAEGSVASGFIKKVISVQAHRGGRMDEGG